MSKKSFGLLLGCIIGSLATTRATVTYVDAVIDENTIATSGAPSHGWYNPHGTMSVSSLWVKRDYGNGKTVYQALGGSSSRDLFEELKTTISGLTPGSTYTIYTFFWDARGSEAWTIDTGLMSGELTRYSGRSSSSILDSSDGNAGNLTFTEHVVTQELDRDLLYAVVGEAVANVDGEIDVFVDASGKGDGFVGRRTWYDGVGFQEGTLASLGLFKKIAPERPKRLVPNRSVAVIPERLKQTKPEPLKKVETEAATKFVPGNSVEVAPDGAWGRFSGECSIWHQGYLYSSYVQSDGHSGLTRYDPAATNSLHMQLSTVKSQQVGCDNNSSITVLPDNRLLVVYSGRGHQKKFYYRISTVATPSTISDWSKEQSHSMPEETTYANTYCLSAESDKIYNFQRCINNDPTFTVSADKGETWGGAQHFINAGGTNQSPYLRYCSNNKDRIDVIYTEDHPFNQPTSLYHMYYYKNNFYKTDGKYICSMASLPMDHNDGEHGTEIYQYTHGEWGSRNGPDDWIPKGRCFAWDITYDFDGNPICVFQVQVNNAAGGEVGYLNDRIYYYYARWTGKEWQRRCIAQAGHGLCNSERNSAGGITLDPEDPRVVYISSNADYPFALLSISNVPVNSENKYEIYRGITTDGGRSFGWDKITSDSAYDNLRPMVPENHDLGHSLIWFRGKYNSNTNFDCKVFGVFGEEKVSFKRFR